MACFIDGDGGWGSGALVADFVDAELLVQGALVCDEEECGCVLREVLQGDRLAGEEIPLAARILRVADSYAAMTDNRPRRIARTDTEARQAMIELAGIEFDPKVVHRFFNVGIQPLRRDG